MNYYYDHGQAFITPQSQYIDRQRYISNDNTPIFVDYNPLKSTTGYMFDLNVEMQ